MPEFKMIIRSEVISDIEAIYRVAMAASFRNHPISNHTEQFIVNALRDAGVLTISLVAEIDKRIVGHIAFSPVTISDGSQDWYGIGPLSVLPWYQRRGVGKSLVNEGLYLLKARGGRGCVLVGDVGYYHRFGPKIFRALYTKVFRKRFFSLFRSTEKCPKGPPPFTEDFRQAVKIIL
jgi:putative acetyltransferase